MECLSCHNPIPQQSAKIFRHMLVCPGCYELAVKAEREITREIERARENALNWLEQHMMRGGLLLGGAGHEAVARATQGIHSGHGSVPQVQAQETDAVPGGRSAAGHDTHEAD